MKKFERHHKMITDLAHWDSDSLGNSESNNS